MKNLLRFTFLIILSIISTSIAGIILYLTPILSHIGSVEQIPFIIEGLLIGALLSSILGFIIEVTINVHKKLKVYFYLAASFGMFLIFIISYYIENPLQNISVFLGSMSSESFLMVFLFFFYNSIGQSSKKFKAISAATFFGLNFIIFIIVALVYESLGEADFPYIIEALNLISIGLLLWFWFLNARISGIVIKK
ncbi:MAG: hypothetical protein ACYDAO_06935 [Thermoplasmataceae archaeon]